MKQLIILSTNWNLIIGFSIFFTLCFAGLMVWLENRLQKYFHYTEMLHSTGNPINQENTQPEVIITYRWFNYLNKRAADRLFLKRVIRYLNAIALDWSLKNQIDDHPPKRTPFCEVISHAQSLLDTQVIWEMAQNAKSDVELTNIGWKAAGRELFELTHRIHELYLERYPLPSVVVQN